MTNQWTLIAKTVEDYITVSSGKQNEYIRRLYNAKSNYSSIYDIVKGHKLKGGTLDGIVRRLIYIKRGNLTELSQLSQISGDGVSTTNSTTTSSSTSSSSSTDSSSTDSSGNSSSTVKKVPITDPKEAMDFALTEWNKIRRTSGHTLECQVFGSEHWKIGEWCKVYIPSLNEYIDMYITKVDNSNDSGSEWLCNITLSDYAPSISQAEETTDEEDNESGDKSVDGTGSSNGDSGSQWSQIASVLQKYYEKPSTGWNSAIQSIRDAKTWDDVNAVTSKMTKKQEYKDTRYSEVNKQLVDIMGIAN